MKSYNFYRKLLRTKDIETIQSEAHHGGGLKKALGVIDLLGIGIGAIIGAGIFVLTGQAAAEYAGPGIVISFILAAIVSGLAGLCYAEFASMIPVAGSAYTYSYATLGEVFAWFIGWDLIIEYSIGASAVAVGWSSYVVSFLRQFGINLPPEFTSPPGTHFVFLSNEIIRKIGIVATEGWYQLGFYVDRLHQAGISPDALPHATGICNLVASFVVLCVTIILVIGIRESSTVNVVIVLLKITVILTVIAVGIGYIQTDNWVPFIPPNAGKYGEYGWSGIMRGAGVVFFAYVGFDAVSTAAQEAKRPQKDMPIGILGSLAICTVLYVSFSLVLTGLVSYSRLNVADPVALAVDATGIHWLAILVKLGAIAGLTSVILVLLMGQPRIFFSMAHDGLLPAFFARVHPRFGTPANTTIVTGFCVGLLASLLPVRILGELVSIGTLAAFILVCFGVLVLRYKRPDIGRPFRIPLSPLLPILGVVSCGALALSLPWEAWLRLVSWLAVGFIIYFFYGIRHSHRRASQKKEISQGTVSTRRSD
ncbi:MAG: APC family permease [Desulfomonilaceae bacterium]